MADNDKKRYYWLKLNKDFFQQHKMKVLKAMPNGRLYALIYLELLAESTSHNGELRFTEMIPYDSVTLAAVIDEDKDNLEKAIETLVSLELIEILEDKTIFMNEIQKMIGSETGVAERVRKHREKEKMLQSNTDVTLLSQKCNLEIRDKRLDIRDKNIDDDYLNKKGNHKKIIEQLGSIHQRNIEAKLYNEQRAYELSQYIAKAYEITGVLPSISKLESIILKITDGGISNELGYIIECFKGEKEWD